MKINKISPQDETFTKGLCQIVKKPKTLYYAGTLPTERKPTIAIVGTRKPSAYGKEITHGIAYELAKQGIVIVSGLALGIDGIAHRAALEADGTTIAVLGNGLPNIYPATHRSLGMDIITKGGALISEYEEDESARPYHFLQRNRLVSGLADAVIITEAAARSGTLNTAMHALDQGKDVFVVPGNITSPLSEGCNALLRQGAQPLLSASDVIEIIAPDLLKPQTSLPLGTTEAETKVLQLLRGGMRDGDKLQKTSGLSAADFSMTLSMLEIAGVIRSLGGNNWTIR